MVTSPAGSSDPAEASLAPDHEVVVPVTSQRYVAPGGWRRAAIGLSVGALAGLAVIGVLDRRTPDHGRGD